MPVSVHPLLREDAEAATTLEEPSDAAVIEAPVFEGDPIVSAEEALVPEVGTAQIDPVEEQYWRLDRKNPVQDFNRLLAESPDLANKYNADIGRKAQRKYQPEIERARAEAEALRAQLAKVQFESNLARMDEADVQKRLQSDPAFARQYHSRGAVPNVAEHTERAAWASAIDDIIESGIDSGLPEQADAAIRKAIADGRYNYDYDRNGRPVRQLAPQEALIRLQRDVNQSAEFYRQQARQQYAPSAAPVVAAPPPPPPPPPAIVGTPNPALQQGADVSGGARTTSARPRTPLSEIRSMPWTERISRFPNLQAALDSGEVYDDSN